MALNIKSIILILLLAFYLYLIFNFLFARTFEGAENMDEPKENEEEKELPTTKTSD